MRGPRAPLPPWPDIDSPQFRQRLRAFDKELAKATDAVLRAERKRLAQLFNLDPLVAELRVVLLRARLDAAAHKLRERARKRIMSEPDSA